MQPRQRGETLKPERPNRRYSFKEVSFDGRRNLEIWGYNIII